MLILYILIAVMLLITIAAYLCYRIAMRVPRRGTEEFFRLPDTEQYTPYAQKTRQLILDALSVPSREESITSYDGLKLCGKCCFSGESAPWIIMLHGYRSRAERDFCGGLKFALESGYNVLLVDQRAHGKSRGKYLSMGIKERRDCRMWVDFLLSRYPNAQILLYGVSMGAATVLMSAALGLPDAVKGIIADCGYPSPCAIIKTVLRKRHYPVFPLYALIYLGCLLFGGFRLDSASAAEAMDKCDIPVLFIHGTDDRFVPFDMSLENYRRCRCPEKELLSVPGAGHGMSYMADTPKYLETVSSFIKKVLAR